MQSEEAAGAALYVDAPGEDNHALGCPRQRLGTNTVSCFLGCPIRKGTTCSRDVHIFNIFKEFGSS